jgi:hypothetical protein
MNKKKFLILIGLIYSVIGYSDEIDELNLFDNKVRECIEGTLNLSIQGDDIKLRNKVLDKQFTKFDESDFFIHGDFISIKNLDFAKKNIIPGILIIKKGKRIEWIEGLTKKFRKSGSKENCEVTNIRNLHCYSNINGKFNLSIHRNRIKYTEKIGKKGPLEEKTYKIERNSGLPSYAVMGVKANDVIIVINMEGVVYKIVGKKPQSANCDFSLTE